MRQHVRRDALAIIDHRNLAHGSVNRCADLDPAAVRGVPGRIGQQVRKHLDESPWIAIAVDFLRRQRHGHRVPAKLHQVIGNFGRVGQNRANCTLLVANLRAVTRGAHDIEHIVDQPGQIGELASDHTAFIYEHRVILERHELQRCGDGRERVS